MDIKRIEEKAKEMFGADDLFCVESVLIDSETKANIPMQRPESVKEIAKMGRS